MTARRGSLQYKIVRLTRIPRAQAAAPSKHRRLAKLAAIIAGRSLMVLAALFVSGTVAVQIWHAGARNMQLHEQTGVVERDNTTLQADNEKLATRVERLRDPEYLVPLIHEQLGLAKPHEVFVEVTQTTPPPTPR